MRDTILTCEVGDDVYEDDPTVNNFQNMAASKLHKVLNLNLNSNL